MAEYKGFDASEKKKRKALEEGNVLKVPYFNQILYFSLLILTTYISISSNFNKKINGIKQCVINPFNMIQSCVGLYTESLFIFCFIPMLISLLLVIAIIGFNNRKNLLVWSLARPNFKKVNPVSGLVNFFGSFKDIWLTILKLAVLFIFLCFFLKSKITFLINNFFQDNELSLYLSILKNFLIYAAIIFFITAIIEYQIKKRRYACELSMSQDELKREYKEDEGDPLIKSQRRNMHEAILMQKIEEKVRKSKVIIVD
ncbi:MAG: EscU/YscU/HrcU family type III secretion system export apparatus switch protein [Bdellovibrionota bacterium]